MTDITALLADEADELLGYECRGIGRDQLYLPGPDFVDRVVDDSDRSTAVQGDLRRIFASGRLAGAMSRSCRSTRASSTRPPPRSRPTRSISTPTASCAWR